MAPIFSIIVCNNNDRLLNCWLLKGLKKQDPSLFELIEIKTVGEEGRPIYDRASEPLNLGASKAKGKYLVFCHNDVEFVSPHFLDDLNLFLETIGPFGVIGNLGCNESGKLCSNVFGGEPNSRHVAGEWTNEVEKVQTLDECFFVMKREGFVPFVDLGKTWDGYAIQQSLFSIIRSDGAIPNYFVPLPMFHRSWGHITQRYLLAITKLQRVARENHIQTLYTCQGVWGVGDSRRSLRIKMGLSSAPKQLIQFITRAMHKI